MLFTKIIKLFLTIILFKNLLIITPTFSNEFLESSRLLSDKEFDQKKTGVTTIDYNDCISENENISSQEWFQKIQNIKIYFNVDKYYRNIFKKLKSPLSIESTNDNSRKWDNYYKGKIQFQHLNCKHKIQYRLTGDLLDHTGLKGGLPHSIKVKLKNYKIENISNFKLYRPKSRMGKYEILMVILNKEFGFLAPRTALINIQIGGQNFKALFQEDISTEFLEDNNIHESLLIEGDEGYHPFTNPIIINQKLITGNYFKKISRDVMEIVGRNYLLTNLYAVLSDDKVLDPPLIPIFFSERDKEEFTLFNLLNFSLKASDGLTLTDMKIVYDHISRRFLPIYYDGHHGIQRQKINFNFNQENKQFLINKLENLNLDKLIYESRNYGAEFTKSEIEKVIIDAINFLKRLSPRNSQKFSEDFIDQIFLNEKNLKPFFLKGGKYLKDALAIKYSNDNARARINTEEMKMSWIQGDNKIKACYIYSEDPKCEIFVNNNESSKLEYPLKPQDLRDGIFQHGVDINAVSEIYSDTISKNILKIDNNGTFVEFTQNLKLDLDYDKKIILISNINKEKQDAQLRVFGGYIDNWKFIAKEDAQLGYKKDDITRASKLGLTGCITFNDIELNNISIELTASNCEDGVHFVRSTGRIKKLVVLNSAQDGIDADFSNLVFDEIDVVNAGNDCLDLSAGSYLILNSKNYNCKDKAVSAGEYSKVNIKNININESPIGMVSKDGSKLTLDDAFVFNAKVCIAAYSKKKGYGGGEIELGSKIDCNNIPSYIQKDSKFSYLINNL
jgi:hypothetical protein